MTLDPEVLDILKEKRGAPLWEVPLEALRAPNPALDAVIGKVWDEVGSTEDTMAEARDSRKVPVRIYLPKEGRASYGTVVYYHGGGFVLGSVERADAVCRRLCNESGCRVVSVDYRLAPESRFPAAAEDAYDAFEWVLKNFESAGVAVMGDSAGGNLAAVVAQLATANGSGPDYQVLVYPVLTVAPGQGAGEGQIQSPQLTREEMDWFHSQYLSDPKEGMSEVASPLLRKELSGLPPALIITAEYDILRPQGEAYADRLRMAGVSCVGVRYSGMPHGFLGYFRVAASRSALSLCANLISRTLHGSQKDQGR